MFVKYDNNEVSVISTNLCKFPQNLWKNNHLKLSYHNYKIYKIYKMSKSNKICIYCKKEFSRSDSCTRHVKTCQFKPVQEQLLLETERYRKLLEEKEKELQKKDEEITFLTTMLNERLCKPTNQTNNVSINITQVLSKMDSIDYEDVNKYIHLLTNKYIDQGTEGLIYFLCEHPYKEKFITTDYARSTLCYKTKNEEIFKDPEGTVLINNSLKNNADAIIEKATDRKKYWKSQIDVDVNDEYQEKEIKIKDKIIDLIKITQQAKDNKVLNAQEIKDAMIILKKIGLENIHKIID